MISPPVRNEIRRGFKLEKSFDGDTTFAATLVFSVAISNAINAMNATTGRWNRPSSTTGSQIACPKITTDAEVTATPMNEYNVIAAGSPDRLAQRLISLRFRVSGEIRNVQRDRRPEPNHPG